MQIINFFEKISLLLLLSSILACSGAQQPVVEWSKCKKLAGKNEKLSHIEDMAIDEHCVYVAMGGTIADQQSHRSGIRKIQLETGAVSTLDDGQALPQSELGGLSIDEKFLYWNAGGEIFRI